MVRKKREGRNEGLSTLALLVPTASNLQLEVWDAKTQKPLLSLDDVSLNETINDVKFAIYQKSAF